MKRGKYNLDSSGVLQLADESVDVLDDLAGFSNWRLDDFNDVQSWCNFDAKVS